MDHRQQLRQTIRNKRKLLSSLEQDHAAQKMTQQFIMQPFFKAAQHMAGYYAVQGEINPAGIIKNAWELQKSCYLPVLIPTTRELTFVHYEKKSLLKPNQYNILEPEITAPPIAPQALDLVIVPLVAFDLHGNRLGTGKGYYDHTFKFLLKSSRGKPFLVGIGYDIQKVKTIETREGDVSLDAIVTEREVYYI